MWGQAGAIVMWAESTRCAIRAWVRDRQQQIRYRASVRKISRGVPFSYVQNSASNVRISLTCGFGEYLLPSKFMRLLFACSSVHPRSGNVMNIPAHCLPTPDAAMHHVPRAWRDRVRRMVPLRLAANITNSNESAVPLLAIKDADLVSARPGRHACHPLHPMRAARARER